MMQNSGVEWIGEIPQDWKRYRIKDVSDLSPTYSDDKPDSEELCTVIPMECVSNKGEVDTFNLQQYQNVTSGLTLFEAGDVIFAKITPCMENGKGAYIASLPTRYAFGSTEFHVMRNCYKLHGKFLYYYTFNDSFRDYAAVNMTGAAGQKRVSTNFLKYTPIYLPKFSEQQTIADYLDNRCGKLDAVIALKQQQIKTLDALRQSIIYHAVTKGLNPAALLVDSGFEWLGEIPAGWRVERIGDVSLKIGSGVTPKGGSTVYLEEGVPLLRSQNIHFSGLRIDDVVFISEETHQEMQGSQVQNNDVLLNITGASLGRCFYFSDDCIFKEANVNQHVCIIRPNHQILMKFLYFFLSSDTGQKQIFSSFRGASREGLNFKEIKTFKLGLPPVSEQQAIVAHLDHETARLNRLKDNLNQQINTLQTYKKAFDL